MSLYLDQLCMKIPTLEDILKEHQRVCIAGSPKAGKSTLARRVNDRTVISTDSYIDRGWDDVPRTIIETLKDSNSYVLEGIQVPRVLRKGLMPDAVLWMPDARIKLSTRQENMRRGVHTVMEEWAKTRRDTKRTKCYVLGG